MKKYIILSVNDNIEYLFYIPLVCWSWEQIGCTPILFFNRDRSNDGIDNPLRDIEQLTIDAGGGKGNVLTRRVESIPGYRSDTVTQISRLYAACLPFIEEDDYIMTGDIDMMALSNYWEFDAEKITVWGDDLTGYKHYPICYIGAKKKKWKQFMKLDFSDYNVLIKRDLDSSPEAKSPDFYDFWFVDQNVITSNIKNFGEGIIPEHRGQYSNGYARWRVDRGDWHLNHEKFVDAHLHRDIFKVFWELKDEEPERSKKATMYTKKWNDTMDLLMKVWPNEDWQWFVDYSIQYAKMTQP
jgi:hypothetical protein